MEDVLLYVFFSIMSAFMVVNGAIQAKEEIVLQFREKLRSDKTTFTQEDEVSEEDEYPGIELVEQPNFVITKSTKACIIM
jgi:hypothetical protein